MIKNKVNEICNKKQLKIIPHVIAVTKTFAFTQIEPLLKAGHNHFGENKIQEAENKWNKTKDRYPNLQLHMLGPIQSNKAKKVVQLFDYIHSLDNPKLAEKISKYENELGKKVKIFIQVNLADESQKSGILVKNLNNFFNFCSKDLSLNIIGLMCIPPVNLASNRFFKILKKLSEDLNLKHLSMGMSTDYEDAIICGATYLRLGTAIMGERKS